jgi:hypothetical protein
LTGREKMKIEKWIKSKVEYGLVDISRSLGIVNTTGEWRNYRSGYSTRGIIL